MEYLKVDFESRKITIPEDITFLGVKDDDETRTLFFKMPKTYKGLDLSDFKIWINYINADKKGDAYPVDDRKEDGEYYTFSWTVGDFAYAASGMVHFLVYVEKENEEGIVVKKLHTTWAKLEVLPGGSVNEYLKKEYP